MVCSFKHSIQLGYIKNANWINGIRDPSQVGLHLACIYLRVGTGNSYPETIEDSFTCSLLPLNGQKHEYLWTI